MNVNISSVCRKERMNIFDMYMFFICLMPLSSLLQEKVDAINRILYVGIFILQIFILCKRISKRYILLFLVAIISYISVLMNTQNLVFSNGLVYYINWIFYAGIMVMQKDRLESWFLTHEKYIRIIMLLWTFLVGISIFMPSSYFDKEAGAKYFCSYTGSSFRLCPTALFIEVLALCSIIFYKRKKDILFMIIPLYCGFMGSSRTYFSVLIVVFVVSIYITSSSMKNFFLKISPIIVVGIYFLGESALMSKIYYTLDSKRYGDFWLKITSSRSIIWEKILRGYIELDLTKKIFGAGFGFTKSVGNHYAHNDFIEILANHGMLGLVIYLWTMYLLFKKYFQKKISLCVIMGCVFVWGVNAMFNMFYWYICTAFCFPLLLAAVSFYYNKNEVK